MLVSSIHLYRAIIMKINMYKCNLYYMLLSKRYVFQFRNTFNFADTLYSINCYYWFCVI